MATALAITIYPGHILRITENGSGFNVTFGSRESGAMFGCNCEVLQPARLTAC
jgi:hypothetical protein